MAALLVVLFIVVPLVELAILIQVGQVIGVAWTIVALVAVSVLGAWLVRREGPRAWRRFRDALGLLLMVPPARAVVARTLKRRLGARMSVSILGTGRGARPARDDVVDVEVVSIERAERDHAATNGEINSRDSG